MKHDKEIEISKNNNGDTLKAVKFGAVWRYYLKFINQDAFITGPLFSTEKEILNNAFSFSLSSLCGCFVKNDFSKDLSAEQCIFYLKRLSDSIK